MKPLIISSGDPSGIGPELILKAWHNRIAYKLPPFCVLGDVDIFKNRARQMGLPCAFTNVDENLHFDKDTSKMPILDLCNKQEDRIGQSLVQNAAGILEAIRKGVALIYENKASCLVTAPIAKETLYKAGFSFPGHTEYLAHLAKEHTKKEYHPVMMLANDSLRVVPITIHIALREVFNCLTQDLIIKTAKITYKDLQAKFGINRPHLVIAGLNPHAGEGGSMGREEIEIIQPAIEKLKQEDMFVTGPYPSDTLFHDAMRAKYDAALCMYHDQALIPIKTIGFDNAVNITLGLPFIRTSPDHGTAFDIAGQNIASPHSFIAAIKAAEHLYQTQEKYDRPTTSFT